MMNTIAKYFPETTARQLEQFAALEGIYGAWNACVNVVSRREIASGELFTRHILHSLALARVDGWGAVNSVVDVGTGGGFPAVPLAILFPGVSFTAVDSIGKKIRVVEEVARAAGLDNLTAVCSRVESLPGRWDRAVSRAVAPAATVLGWVWPRVASDVLLLKGGDLTVELAATGRPYSEFDVAQWFEDPFFETKKVIHFKK
jgi:16S rRNA (guanine527-N7)-methyltransferase